MPNYLPGMLEVPWIEGQSECPCGRDDRYYAFGLWTDYCGMSMKELKKYNSFCGENCEGGGGGGGCKPCPCPDCPPCPEPPVPPEPTPTTGAAFRFTLVSTTDRNPMLLTSEFVASMLEGYFYARNYVDIEISIGDPGSAPSPYEFRTYADSVPIDDLDNMPDAEAQRAITGCAFDIVFAVDNRISSWNIVDGLGLPFETEGHRFEQIGTVVYGDTTFKILRYKNPANLSPAYDPTYDPTVRTFVIRFIKN